jgi:hypothetical protein
MLVLALQLSTYDVAMERRTRAPAHGAGALPRRD